MEKTDYAFTNGFECGLNGPNAKNCDCFFYSTMEIAVRWMKGKHTGERAKLVIEQIRDLKSSG